MQIQTDPKLLDLVRRQTEAMEKVASELRIIRKAVTRRDDGSDGAVLAEASPIRLVAGETSDCS